jgi:hypothetical protein
VCSPVKCAGSCTEKKSSTLVIVCAEECRSAQKATCFHDAGGRQSVDGSPIRASPGSRTAKAEARLFMPQMRILVAESLRTSNMTPL